MQLTIDKLGKRYGAKTWALRDFSLDLGPGVLGLLGPNGAGKTTLMNLLATLTRPTEGSVRWDGVDTRKDPEALRRVLGYLPQDFGVYPNLSAREFLEYLAAVKGLARREASLRIDMLLDLVNLRAAKDRPLSTFSGGMKQRVGIAQALLNDPEVLIVDEPTVGLDPEERVRFRNLIAHLAGDRIVILSTHIVSDVETAATEIAMLKEGRLLGHHSPEEWLSGVTGTVWNWTVPSDRLAEIQSRYRVSQAIRRADGVHLRLLSESPPDGNARRTEPTLEDAYMTMVSDGHRK